MVTGTLRYPTNRVYLLDNSQLVSHQISHGRMYCRLVTPERTGRLEFIGEEDWVLKTQTNGYPFRSTVNYVRL